MTSKLLTFLLFASLVLGLFSAVSATEHPKTVCFWESWVHWRTGDGKQDPSEIDYHLCTHLVYSYMGIEAGTHEIKLLDPYLMNDLHDLDKFVRAKGTSKALVAIGSGEAAGQFSATVSSDYTRSAFVASVLSFLLRYSFDGVLIEWTGMSERDSENFIALLDKFDEKFASTAYTLAVTVPSANMPAYNIPKIAVYTDFINVIAHDLDGPWSKVVGHASPMSQQLTILESYVKRGAPRAKLIMSVPLYGRSWRLANPSKQSLGDEAIGAGTKGPYTQTEGMLGYNELCVMIRASPSSYSIVRDQAEHAVYAIYLHGSTAEFISFEDTKTLASKAENITREGYGGMSVYSLSNEDVHGTCGTKYPLLHAITEHYYTGAVTVKPVVTIPPVTHTTEHVTFPPGVFHCSAKGKYRDHVYCFKYYDCETGEFGGLEETILYCERHQAWDEKTQQCVDSKMIPGC